MGTWLLRERLEPVDFWQPNLSRKLAGAFEFILPLVAASLLFPHIVIILSFSPDSSPK